MPRIPPSLFDQDASNALAQLTADETNFLGMGKPVTALRLRSLPAARNSQPYRNRRACAGNTNCIPICPIQAKYDPTITLSEATNGGAKLIDHAVASEILVENDLVSGINFITYKGDAGPKTGTGCIKAKVYVIAANGIETPRLLLMSKNGGRTPNGVANSSDMVGRNLMDHPQYVTWGLLPPTSKPAYPYRGPLITSAIGDLCDGPFRATRAAFRVSFGNEGWNFVVGGGAFGADPHVTTLDFVNGMNSSKLNTRAVSQLAADNSALFGAGLAETLRDLISRQFRIAFACEQDPDPINRVTLSTVTDALNLPRPKIAYDISDYTKQGIVTAVRLKRLIFKKLGATKSDFTERAAGDPAGFDEKIDDQLEQLTYGGAGHVMGTYRMGRSEDIGRRFLAALARSPKPVSGGKRHVSDRGHRQSNAHAFGAGAPYRGEHCRIFQVARMRVFQAEVRSGFGFNNSSYWQGILTEGPPRHLSAGLKRQSMSIAGLCLARVQELRFVFDIAKKKCGTLVAVRLQRRPRRVVPLAESLG